MCGIQLHFLPTSHAGELDKISCTFLFVLFWGKKHRFPIFCKMVGCSIPCRSPLWHLFSVPPALADTQIQWHVALFHWRTASVVLVIMLAPEAKRAQGNHPQLDFFTPETSQTRHLGLLAIKTVYSEINNIWGGIKYIYKLCATCVCFLPTKICIFVDEKVHTGSLLTL